MVRELSSIVYQSGYVPSNNEYCSYPFAARCGVEA